MKHLNNKYCVEATDKRHIINPTGDNILKERKENKSLKTMHQIINETKVRRNQKANRTKLNN